MRKPEESKKKESVKDKEENAPKMSSIVCTVPIEDCVAVHDGDCSRCPLF